MLKLIKLLITIAVFIVTFYYLIHGVDGWIVNAIVSLLPASAADWIPFATVVLWIALVIMTCGLAFGLSMLASLIVLTIFFPKKS